MPADVVVVGSVNMDLVMRVGALPAAGETIIGHGFQMAEGGKGGNQAVSIARMGAGVALIGRLGDDPFAGRLRAALAADGVDITQLLTSAACPTGVAMILVEEGGENRIILAQGANLTLGVDDIAAAAALIGGARLLVTQLEIPIPAVAAAIELAARAGVRVVLNPAPACAIPDALWPLIDIVIPNETEASILCGMAVCDEPSAVAAARLLRARGVRQVLITLGAQGVLIADDAGERLLQARQVTAIDTTAAGDSFIGAFVASLSEGASVDDAAARGIAAASLCVSRLGAQPSLPWRHELAGGSPPADQSADQD